MFGENESQKKLREEWPNMSKDDKWDTFLWKMSWFHSNIHIPGAPPHDAINHLSDMLNSASKSSDKLTRSIRRATWVGGIAATLGVIIAMISLFK
jgi:hypothetical protein